MSSTIRSNYIHVAQNVFFQILNVGFFLFLTSKVSVKELAIYGVVKSLFSLLEYSHLGSRFGLDAVLSGRNESEVNSYTRLTASISFWVSLLFLIIITIVYQDILVFIFLFGAVFYYQFNIYRLSNRATGNSELFVKQSILINYIPVLFQIAGLLILGFEGLFWAFLLSGLFLYFTKKGDVLKFLSPKIKVKEFKFLFLNGRAFLTTSLSFMAVTVLDRVFIDNISGPKITGYYTFIFIFISFLSVIPNAITELLLSKFFDVNRQDSSSRDLLKNSTLTLFLITATSIVGVIFFVDLFIETFFLKYVEIIAEIKFALLYVLPASLVSVFQYFIISYKKNREIMIINIIALIAFYLTFFLMAFYSSDLNLHDFVLIRVMHIWFYFILTSFVLFMTISTYEKE